MLTRPSAPPKHPVVALLGNPNAGKTSLFNALTGGHQKVANYAGVTVERASGFTQIGDQTVEFVDVPGLYSLNAISEDEIVARDALLGQTDSEPAPDLWVCVLDATNLERHLFFFSELADFERPMLVALTMVDVLEGGKATIDTDALQQILGVPVIPIVSHRGLGIPQIKEAVVDALRHPSSTPPVGHEAGATTRLSVAERYQWAADVRRDVVVAPTEGPQKSSTDKIDRILTHRVFGFAIFVGIMYLVFQSIYTFSAPLMDLIGSGFDAIKNWIGPSLAGTPVIRSLVTDGIITGVGGVITFLPQILILFFFIAALEGTGYLARAAFMMDRLLGWCGLSGRAFIPLLSSFACAIPGIMAARVMPDQRSRLATIMIAPLMSCSARLPVYILLIGVFIEPKYGAGWAGFALFAMHFVGAIVAIPVVLILNRKLLRGKRLPFVLELPAYQWPKWRDVVLSMWIRGKSFVQTAGTIIVLMSVLMWALLYFPGSSDEAKARYRTEFSNQSELFREKVTADHYVQTRVVENSYLGRFGRSIEPVFAPAGFDWRLSTAILAAFPAREVVVPSIGIIFSIGNDVDEGSTDLRTAIQTATWPDGRPLLTAWTATGFMVFFALCCQCMSTLAAVRRETNSWKWPLFMFSYMTILAYLAAVGINLLAKVFG